jgi:hypothetical protein
MLLVTLEKKKLKQTEQNKQKNRKESNLANAIFAQQLTLVFQQIHYNFLYFLIHSPL